VLLARQDALEDTINAGRIQRNFLSRIQFWSVGSQPPLSQVAKGVYGDGWDSRYSHLAALAVALIAAPTSANCAPDAATPHLPSQNADVDSIIDSAAPPLGGTNNAKHPPGFGNDTVTDLDKHDTLDLTGLGFNSLQEVWDNTMDVGSNAVITSGADTITLEA
jgi:hypothetical protein